MVATFMSVQRNWREVEVSRFTRDASTTTLNFLHGHALNSCLCNSAIL
jgi:hypothetical protein